MTVADDPVVVGHIATLQRVSQAVMANDADLLRSLFTPDFVDHNPEWGVRTVDDLVRCSANIGAKLDTQVTLLDMFGVGDKLVAQVSFSGQHRGDAFGFAPTGEPVSWEAVEIYRFAPDGRIAEVWHYSQFLVLLQQLGLELGQHANL